MRRIKLRLFDELGAPEAGPDALRSKLGGRAEVSDPAVGDLVHVRGRVAPSPAVVLFADAGDAHVWIGEGLVRRVKRTDLSPHEGETAGDVAKLAGSARSFAELAEGDHVTFVDPEGALTRGTLLEKHRFGALVADPSGRVSAVGFRRLSRDKTTLSLRVAQEKQTNRQDAKAAKRRERSLAVLASWRFPLLSF